MLLEFPAAPNKDPEPSESKQGVPWQKGILVR